MNYVIVKFICGLDMDEDFESASMETSNSEKTTAIEFQGKQQNKVCHFSIRNTGR
jgi:hypothetical protein